MKPTEKLHALGQQLWLDDISRGLLAGGTLDRYIAELSLTGLTAGPGTYERAIRAGGAYDAAIGEKTRDGKSAEALFFELAVDDLAAAAELLRQRHDASGGRDGWVSLALSPGLAADPVGTMFAARRLFARCGRPNVLIAIPGTRACLTAIEESVFHGVPVNVTLLFSREQYILASVAYIRGLERRVAAGLDPNVASVVSVGVSGWDAAANDRVSGACRNRLGIAIARRVYKAWRDVLGSQRWRLLAERGARPQRLLWTGTACDDPAATATLYVDALAAPDTISTMAEPTLLAYAEHGRVAGVLAPDGGDAEAVIAEFIGEGIEVEAMAAELQRAASAAQAASWAALMQRIATIGSEPAAAVAVLAATD